jgi:DNA-binding MarR family transcriptional regulator
MQTRTKARTRDTPTETDLAVAIEALMQAYVQWARTQVSLTGTGYSRMRLLYALQCEGPQKMADLADELGVTPRNITALVDGLEADGLVRRTDHPTDRRVTMIELTQESPEAGEAFLAYRAATGHLFEGLSPDDRREFQRLTSLLVERMRSAPPRPAREGT